MILPFFSITLFFCLFPAFCAGEQQTAPPFALYDINGKLVKQSDFKGQKVVLLSFFATYCKPCLGEIGEFKKLNGDNEKFEVILISGENKKKVVPFVKKHQIDFKVLLDPFGAASRSYKVRGLPTLFLIDRNGDIVFSSQGSTKETIEKLKAEIKRLAK